MNNDYEIGMIIGKIETLSTKIEANTRLMSKMEDCMSESKREGKSEIARLSREISRTNERLDVITNQLSMYSTVIKVVKTLFYGGLLILTFKLGDVRDLIGNIWK